MEYIKLFESREEEIENLKNIFLEDVRLLIIEKTRILNVINSYFEKDVFTFVRLDEYGYKDGIRRRISCRFAQNNIKSKDMFSLSHLMEDLKDFNNYIEECFIYVKNSELELAIYLINQENKKYVLINK